MANKSFIYLSSTRRDEAAALALKHGMERFRVPPEVPASEERRHYVKRRKIFRHSRESPRESRIPEQLEYHIGEAEVFILICSSASATSRWIAAELDAFYQTHPRGPVIPVVLEGEPDPSASQRAYEKPCFPANLRKGDIDRWIDARDTDWEETAPVATLASLLGIRVEQLIFHLDRKNAAMGRQRTAAVVCGSLSLALASLWTFREQIHEQALASVWGYEKGVGDKVGSWLASVRPGYPAMPYATADLDLQPTSAPPSGRVSSRSLPSPKPSAIPAPAPDVVKEPPRQEAPSTTAPKTVKAPATSVPPPVVKEVAPPPVEADPEVTGVAVMAWLDRAESLLPANPGESRQWLRKCEAALAHASTSTLGNEIYRYHALSAVTARFENDAETARSELLKAVEAWTHIPLGNDPRGREREAFDILQTIAPVSGWSESVRTMLDWLTRQPGDVEQLLVRTRKLEDLAVRHLSLTGDVDAWFQEAPALVEPEPEDEVVLLARFRVREAEFAARTDRFERSQEILGRGIMLMEQSGDLSLPLHQALKAQMAFREGRSKAGAEKRLLEEILPALEAGNALDGWREWFTGDVADAWVLRGDLNLEIDAFDPAIEAYGKALEFAPSPEDLGRILLRSGCAYRSAGDHAGAWDAFSLAGPIFEKSEDYQAQALALFGQAQAASKLDRDEEEREILARADALKQQLGGEFEWPVYWRGAPTRSGEAQPRRETVKVADPAPPAPPAPTPQPQTKSPPAPSSPGELVEEYDPVLEAKIAKVQKEIAAMEGNERNRQSFEGLNTLQALYEELDRLLRKKITGSSEGLSLPPEVEAARPAI